MRKAMQEAVVGDDVYGEDPTINQLQALAAKVTGKEAALWVPSGTMGNLSAVLAHCGRGDEVIVGDESHVYHYEGGGMSAFGGVAFHVLPTRPNGEIPLEALQAAVRPFEQHSARTGCVCLESSHNRCGGPVLDLGYMEAVHSWAEAQGLPIHLDGARVFNAATYLGVPVAAIAAQVTSMQFCLSKGLGAPVGSMVVGPRAFIGKVHHLRKMLGGGLRQAGVVAAPGIISLTQISTTLANDHANARLLAEGLAKLPQIDLDLSLVHTNIVFFKLRPGSLPAADFVNRLKAAGFLVSLMNGGVRAVTHYDVTPHAPCAS
ncbi:hypothetical protein WJX72_007383 [[Myrmecia] bisecta]|uniref:Aromatic amino acid beta-eliminating lyase/threonine aldolase domain-containing protein n=1 Tax=[Myrmecia] bisecta TaxID=41462 RepID=A0AAW1R7U6_9CHLO